MCRRSIRSLAELLNPAIGQGRAGVGSQTGIEPQQAKILPLAEGSPPSRPSGHPSGQRWR